MITDPIADLLTRIRNAASARKDEVTISHSNLKIGVLNVLQKRKFIKEFNVIENGKFKEIKIILDPEKGKFNLKRVSKPGQRIYEGSGNLKKIYGGLGVRILSTSQGVMSAEEAKKLNIGGEVLCEVY